MGALLYASAMIFLLVGFFVSASLVSALIGILILVLVIFTLKCLLFYIKELIFPDQRPPVAGLMFNLLINFHRLFDYQTSVARKYRTFCLLASSYSKIFTADPVNIEYVLIDNFIFEIIRCKREQMRNEKLDVSAFLIVMHFSIFIT